ncbi:MAG: formate hydrogenlyase [Gammaproteobacteria bacterium]|nr:formate hydrogenlyase [Gammaproteobacteria bacterium]MBU6509590.1 formate hydrogenlyase [Gammaproteobacteria bacterium]MDE1984331.1 formate hydrogenlyase [Gammaproteobacteria bacterium]MDE2108624.1 formate hydrogenlyase [Gammaproteobacteria bacterium]MDE2461029.1 formate hydrogenlyase [Gammaproteobacteria bacterium]
MASLPLELINTCAALLLLLSFAMLSQRRVLTQVDLYAAQGLVLSVSIFITAWSTHQLHLYFSCGLTLLLKVLVLPLILRRLIHRLDANWETETLLNMPSVLLIGLLLVMFAFVLAQPISELATTLTHGTLGIALAVVMLAFLMMITRRKAVSQVVGFLAMENGLLFAAASTTYGMPMAVELGVGLDVLVGMIILGIFLFHIREQFESLDLSHLESLKED